MTYSAACFSTVFLNSTRRVALVEQELFTLPEHLNSRSSHKTIISQTDRPSIEHFTLVSQPESLVFIQTIRYIVLTLRVALVEQELFTLPEHLNSPPVVRGVHVTRSLV
jgi:hypothetical protein